VGWVSASARLWLATADKSFRLCSDLILAGQPDL